MHLRPITAADIPTCTTLSDAAFANHELGNWQHPNRFTYAASWRTFALNAARAASLNPANIILVCVADSSDAFAEEGEILGVARWVRMSAPEDAEHDAAKYRRALTLGERVEAWLVWAEGKWESTLRLNPAVGWKQMDVFANYLCTSTSFAPLRGETHWWLDSLSVAPSHQGRGVGRKLVQWCVEQAREENEERVAAGKKPVPIALISTAEGLQFYRRCGFRVVGWADDTFMGIEGGSLGGAEVAWDGSGYWVKGVDVTGDLKKPSVDGVYTTHA